MATGTPPRVWGKRGEVVNNQRNIRYTPTRVGKTGGSLVYMTAPIGTPPRVWGKHLAILREALAAAGTPPRVWGKRCAAQPGDGRRLVHPHACGENARRIAPDAAVDGTPPRVWGKLSQSGNCHDVYPVHPHACGENVGWTTGGLRSDRYTPTRVGKTHHLSYTFFGTSGTPPRVWGKLTASSVAPSGLFGTPPRVWGKREEV